MEREYQSGHLTVLLSTTGTGISGTAIRAAMWLGLGPLTPRSRDSPAWSSFCVAVGAVLTAWRTPARRP